MTEPEQPKRLGIHIGPGATGLVFDPGGSGWAAYQTEGSASLTFIRFARLEREGPCSAREVLLQFMPGDGTRALREVPLGRLEAAVNRPEIRADAEAAVPLQGQITVAFPRDSMRSGHFPWWMYGFERSRPPRLKIKGAQDRRKPDGFYEQVAERFAYLATVSTSPAEDLAAANDVPSTTVHGWVKEARRRRLLVAGERSRLKDAPEAGQREAGGGTR